MKHMGEMLLRKDPFSEIVMGNTALVRGIVESGTRVVTSYPGSPTPEIATAIKSIPKNKRPFYFEFSTNEKVATEVAYGAAVNGHLSTVFFKSVGLNVAADTFVQLSLMNIIGGMVIVLGDDPGANSSQNEQDNRHLAQLCYTPVLEPSSPSETYSYYKEAVKLSTKHHMPVILRMTTHVCHAKEKVSFKSYQPRSFDDTPRFNVENGPYIPITTEVFPKKRNALANLQKVEDFANNTDINKVIDHNNKKQGIITMGLPFLSVMDVLQKATAPPDILKLGIIYPLPKKQIKTFLEMHEEVKILEELDDVLEKEIKALAYDEKLSVKIMGKNNMDEWVGEYTPDKVYDIIEIAFPGVLPPKTRSASPPFTVPGRPAQMCPGCGHRSAFHAIKKALSGTEITVADIGCHTLGFLPPYNMGELLMCMGASTSIGSGLSLFNTNKKVLVFMGDSTFFHAGLPGIINALYNKHNVTMLLMENGTTAMTGHQDHAATGENFNEPTEKIPIRNVLEGLGVNHIYESDTYQQEKLTGIVKQAMENNEFSVVIARHPCMLKFMRQKRRKPDYAPKRVSVDQKICERIHECNEIFACPSFTRGKEGQVQINPDLCIGDGSCVQTCPSKAIDNPKNILQGGGNETV